jgi:hypothetical protein
VAETTLLFAELELDFDERLVHVLNGIPAAIAAAIACLEHGWR